MKLLLRGHDDRYAVEQLQLALFPEEPMEPVTEPFSGDGAVSSLHTGAVWLTATAEITLHGKTGRACRRLRAAEADVPARRRLLQNTYYEAAMCLREPPAWGSLSGVRPTKLTTRALLEGRTPAEAEKLLRRQSMTQFTPHTVTDVDALLQEIEDCRRCGYAIENGEYKIGLRSISAPIRTVDGCVRYTVGVIGMFRSTRSDEFHAAIERVCAAAAMISAALGYRE